MGQNPLNLALRFVLEIVALVSIGYWGWKGATGALRYLLAIAAPLVAAVLWATFRVPGDASASGEAPVPMPGRARLLLELALFGFATWGLYISGATQAAVIFGGVVVVHYAVSYDRVGWLLKQQGAKEQLDD